MSDDKLVKTIMDAVDAVLFGAVFFAVERLLKFAHDQNKMAKKMLSQLNYKVCEKNLLQREEELSQCEKAFST